MNNSLIFLLPSYILLSACTTVPAREIMSSRTQPSTNATPDVASLALVNIQAQKTLEAMQITSQAISADLTATAYFPTRESMDTATERAWLLTGWTATASLDQTATAASGTATQQSRDAVATQQAVDINSTVGAADAAAKATALHGEAVKVELTIERERMMNTAYATMPLTLLCILFVFCLVLVYRWSKIRPIQRDDRGDAPLLVINGSVYDADRNPYSLLDYSGKKPVIPALTSSEIQSATTQRDQMVDLATRGIIGEPGSQRRLVAQQMAAQNLLPAPAIIQVISPEQARPLLGNAIDGIVRDAIDADISQQEQEND